MLSVFCAHRLAMIKPGHVVCDPMCGTGSISIQVSFGRYSVSGVGVVRVMLVIGYDVRLS